MPALRIILSAWLIAASAAAPSAVFAQTEEEMKRLDELDRKCESARAAKLAPIRAELIDRCTRVDKRPRDVCEAEYASYGNTHQVVGGRAVAGMFYDLPECVAAFEARQKYRR
jgi:hypothetical protein